MEKKVIDRFYHEHPLVLTEDVTEKESCLHCYGCGNPVTNLEVAYVCTVQDCSDRIILHKKCGELPSQILHPKHPQHPLQLYDHHQHLSAPWCDICQRKLGMALGYRCSSCDFDVDITCPRISIDATLEEKRELRHPSHPHHPLTLMRKSPFPFYCDGCGAEDVDMAYICSICEIWVHKSCALLPLVLATNRHHHHHDLTLAFSFPTQHREYIWDCDVCHKRLNTTCWVYFCGDCRFFAHLRCVAFTTAETTKQDSNLEEDGTNLIEFPICAHDMSKELITPFVMRENGLNKIPDVKDMPTTVNMPQTTASFSFLFNCHKSPLSLVAEPNDDNKIMHEEDEDGDEATNDELKICDVCVTPISSPPYYECAPCKYFVHSICYLLPKTLSSSSSPDLYGECPKTHDKNHKYTLYKTSELLDMDKSLCRCDLCGYITNGMVYECEGCEMKIDVKCASLPTSIRHASHRHHKRLVLNRIPSEDGKMGMCHGCGFFRIKKLAYCCSSDDCDFELDLCCALLPASITSHEWDKYHSLMLSFDASRDHPSDFICDFCEKEMHPKKWMYHCCQCDLSFHVNCLRTASGGYRNIKFGRRFVLEGIHPNHPLTFSCVTIKRICDLCHAMEVYNYCGFECASCNFAVCITCGWIELDKMYLSVMSTSLIGSTE